MTKPITKHDPRKSIPNCQHHRPFAVAFDDDCASC